MTLRALSDENPNPLARGKREIPVFLLLAAVSHWAFFFVWGTLDVSPFSLPASNFGDNLIPVELVLELSAPPEGEGLPDPGDSPLLSAATDLASLLPLPPPVPEDAEKTPDPGAADPAPLAMTGETGPISPPLVGTEPLMPDLDPPRSFPLSPGTGPDNTVNLEETAPSVKSYDITIRTAVARHWILPPEAGNNFVPARFTASMTLDPSGRVILIMVESSSGNPILDHAAMEALRGAAPYEPFPENLAHLDRMTFTMHFDYKAVRKKNLPER
ncbi:MAG: TonB C-terminal domain-containing protein [Deltaproteobacteria bacterium]|jgi:TonB family protein|nr:TonB C-terminal domain-containing protein [Deltaproteobacteria bacterium]